MQALMEYHSAYILFTKVLYLKSNEYKCSNIYRFYETLNYIPLTWMINGKIIATGYQHILPEYSILQQGTENVHLALYLLNFPTLCMAFQ